MLSWSRVHVMFLRFFMAKGCATKHACKEYLKKIHLILNVPDQEEKPFEDIIREINNKIENLGFKIVRELDEVSSTKDEWFGVRNTKVNDFEVIHEKNTRTVPGTSFSKAETMVFKKVFDIIRESNSGKTNEENIFKVTQEEKSLNMNRRKFNGFLNSAYEENWLRKVDNFVVLGIRSIIEFEFMNDNNIDKCSLCRQPVIYGPRCSKCASKYHKYCSEGIFQGVKHCLKCKSPWEPTMEVVAIRNSEEKMEMEVED